MSVYMAWEFIFFGTTFSEGSCGAQPSRSLDSKTRKIGFVKDYRASDSETNIQDMALSNVGQAETTLISGLFASSILGFCLASSQ